MCTKWVSVDGGVCAKHTGMCAGPGPVSAHPRAAEFYEICESPPLNIGKATTLANTKDFGAVLPWGHMPVHEVVNIMQRRVYRSSGGFAYTMDVYHESASAAKAECAMRLQTGWKQVLFFFKS